MSTRSGYIAMGGAIRDFDRFAIGQWLRDKTSLPVSVENDANCALLAERWLGKAQEMSDFLMMTIGTGIGGAIFCNNALVRGRQRRAGEFGSLLTSRPGSDSVLNYTMNTTCTMRVLTRNYSLHTGGRRRRSAARRFLSAMIITIRFATGWLPLLSGSLRRYL